MSGIVHQSGVFYGINIKRWNQFIAKSPIFFRVKEVFTATRSLNLVLFLRDCAFVYCPTFLLTDLACKPFPTFKECALTTFNLLFFLLEHKRLRHSAKCKSFISIKFWALYFILKVSTEALPCRVAPTSFKSCDSYYLQKFSLRIRHLPANVMKKRFIFLAFFLLTSCKKKAKEHSTSGLTGDSIYRNITLLSMTSLACCFFT